MSSLPCVQRRFSQLKLVKTLLCTQLKQTNLENQLHILTERSKESFNYTICQHFVNELKHCNPEL